MPDRVFACRFCRSSDLAASHTAREMMFGLREAFTYHECGGCGSLQIGRIPDDLDRHYPPEYLTPRVPRSTGIRRWLASHQVRQLLGFDRLVGRLAVRLLGRRPMIEHLGQADVGLEDAILEVGCGRGELLREMRDAGFRDLTGVDPHAEEELRNSLRVVQGTLQDMDRSYDLILFNHALEHVPDPHEELRLAAVRLAPGGKLLVRLPVAGTHAWRTYGTDWVQLDPPRHLAIPSEVGMRTLAERAGFEVEDVVYDSTAFQFWGSEQYRREIPLMDPRSHFVNPKASVFSKDRLTEWETEARRLNEARDGDGACFFLGKR